jgi:hypothetical protein
MFDFLNLEKNVVQYATDILGKYPEILSKNTRTFIPAHIRRVGHNSVRDLVFKLNEECVVALINGYEKTLQYKDNGNIKTLPLASEDEEVCETIARLVNKHGLQHRPLVVTGFLCVGMGQTLTHKDMGSFTSAIFGHMDLPNDEIYQLFGRITGRMKDWKKYVQTQVYCPTTIMHRCSVMEECARNMARNRNGEEVSQEDYRQPMTKLGDAGESAIQNIRVRTEKPIKPKKPEDEDTLVPLIITATEEEWETIHKDTNNIWNVDSIFNVIKNYQPNLAESLKTCKRDQISKVSPERSAYKKTIVRAKDYATRGKKMFIHKTTSVEDDSFSIYLDEPYKTLCVCVHFGKTPVDKRPVIV